MACHVGGEGGLAVTIDGTTEWVSATEKEER